MIVSNSILRLQIELEEIPFSWVTVTDSFSFAWINFFFTVPRLIIFGENNGAVFNYNC